MHRLRQHDGFEVHLDPRGAAIRRIVVPLPGGPIDTVLDYPDEVFRGSDPYYLGVTCGRYANRLGESRVRIGDTLYPLEPTPGQDGNTLHGGARGFSHLDWTSSGGESEREVTFELTSPDGDQGFPGTLVATVAYRLIGPWTLAIDMTAQSDAPTVVNLANHAYFNLSGGVASAQEHLVWLEADRYMPVSSRMIPDGGFDSVADTPFDLRRPVRIRDQQNAAHPQLRRAGGFDHNFELRGLAGILRPAGGLIATDTGLKLTVDTTQPGLQFYGGQHLDAPFSPGFGVCLEAQQHPDAPNQVGLPGGELQPGEVWRQRTVYRFERTT